ncbi:hypothetical protein Salat_2379800 [Sesamum alatum]|uniref:Uncharacterized protein n=1 Tax=Sesamum alatum TaxID=300844 RepID=A0AAE1XXX9_9LAMI|nr:hypothetical protein Salat_2379800 [Sesamum alatum]
MSIPRQGQEFFFFFRLRQFVEIQIPNCSALFFSSELVALCSAACVRQAPCGGENSPALQAWANIRAALQGMEVREEPPIDDAYELVLLWGLQEMSIVYSLLFMN